MILSAALASVFVAASALVNASPVEPRDNDFASAFVNALKKDGETSAANAYKDFFAKDESKPLIDILKNGPVTVFVPKNEAFDSDHPSIDDNLFFFNTLYGNIENGFATPGSSLTRRTPNQSRLSGTSSFQSPGLGGATSKRAEVDGSNQVQQVTQSVSSGFRKRWSPIITIDLPVGSSNVEKRFKFKNVDIFVIDTLPPPIPTSPSDVLCKALIPSTPGGFVKFGSSLQKADLLNTLDQGRRSTIFAPTDDAFKDIDIDNISKDDLAKILKNHFAIGTIARTADWPFLQKITTESGNELKLLNQNGINTVSCGKNTAQVLRSDVSTSNGVLHVIDSPLKCD